MRLRRITVGWGLGSLGAISPSFKMQFPPSLHLVCTPSCTPIRPPPRLHSYYGQETKGEAAATGQSSCSKEGMFFCVLCEAWIIISDYRLSYDGSCRCHQGMYVLRKPLSTRHNFLNFLKEAVSASIWDVLVSGNVCLYIVQ
jgi:hypothetical protein